MSINSNLAPVPTGFSWLCTQRGSAVPPLLLPVLPQLHYTLTSLMRTRANVRMCTQAGELQYKEGVWTPWFTEVIAMLTRSSASHAC